MNKFYIFMTLLALCLSYYNGGPHYRPRYATRLSRLGLPYPFRNKLPFGKPQYHNDGFQTRLYRRRQDYRSAPTRMHGALRSRWVTPKHPNSSLSIFGFIKNTMVGATSVTEDAFPWIALIVGSERDPSPTVCTASCIEERIFITAAICIYRLKLVYSRVHYQGVKLKPIAFVLPSKPTKQMFFDIGIIVVDKNFTKEWKKIPTKNVTWADDEYMWHLRAFSQITYGKVVGYVDGPEPEYFRRSVSEDDGGKLNGYPLYELDVTVGTAFCNYAYSNNIPNDAYFVPCYVTCYPAERAQNLSKCYKNLAGMGYAVKDYFQDVLIGIATWGGYIKDASPALPVGMAVPGSPSYKADLACAQKIKAAETNQTLHKFCNQ